MKLLLIRHGESEGNAEGRMQGQGEYPLSALGRQQAECLAARLATQFPGLSIIYASSLGRAAETAAILATRFGVPVVPDDRLREYHVGEITGLTAEEIRARLPALYAAWQSDTEAWICPPGGETGEAFWQRVGEVLAAIVQRHQADEGVAVVTHGGVLGAYLSQFMGRSLSRRNPFRFANASLTILDFARRWPRLDVLNDTWHLNGLQHKVVRRHAPNFESL